MALPTLSGARADPYFSGMSPVWKVQTRLRRNATHRGIGAKSLKRLELSNRSPGRIEPPEGDPAMNPPDELLKHAADCEQMAKFARDAESKATWNRMAERWRRCAEKFTTESL